jgi:hypothetical protein
MNAQAAKAPKADKSAKAAKAATKPAKAPKVAKADRPVKVKAAKTDGTRTSPYASERLMSTSRSSSALRRTRPSRR